MFINNNWLNLFKVVIVILISQMPNAGKKPLTTFQIPYCNRWFNIETPPHWWDFLLWRLLWIFILWIWNIFKSAQSPSFNSTKLREIFNNSLNKFKSNSANFKILTDFQMKEFNENIDLLTLDSFNKVILRPYILNYKYYFKIYSIGIN